MLGRLFKNVLRLTLCVGSIRHHKTGAPPQINIEELEPREVPAIVFVNTKLDAGPDPTFSQMSLRSAIQLANSPAGFQIGLTPLQLAGLGTHFQGKLGNNDIIAFSIGNGNQILTPTTPLPTITRAVGIGQFVPANLSLQTIQIDGGGTLISNGLTISASGVSVVGLSITRFRNDGILVTAGVTNGSITDNYIGVTSQSQAVGMGNRLNGIELIGATGVLVAHNTIENNLLGSGIIIYNTPAIPKPMGIAFPPASNTISGNVIGNTIGGTQRHGVSVVSASNNLIDGNIVIGNKGNGIEIIRNLHTAFPTSPSSNVVIRNFIGISSGGGSSPLGIADGNGENGILVSGGSGNRIGAVGGFGNVISANTRSGIQVTNNSIQTSIVGNYIGTSMRGTETWDVVGHSTGNGTDGIKVSEGAQETIIYLNTIADNRLYQK